MISALYPFPGSKQKSKYDRVLFAPLDCTAICEPFMGAATRSLLNPRLPPVLGEINAAQRAIALCLGDPQGYCDGYRWAIDQFWGDVEQNCILDYVGMPQSQKRVTEHQPELSSILTRNWKWLLKWLFLSDPLDPTVPGMYAFCIRAAFGNVMRLSPSGAGFNVSWHVDKLDKAMQHDPDEFIASLQRQRWNPTVRPDWQSAIAHVVDPHATWCLLDPPYWVDGKEERCTPCYLAHSIGTKQEHIETLELATASLESAIAREFHTISVCNYRSDRLEDFVRGVAGSYAVQSTLMGECNALGNSNGRLKHGGRKDGRKRPVEIIYRLERKRSRVWHVSQPVTNNSTQLSLI